MSTEAEGRVCSAGEPPTEAELRMANPAIPDRVNLPHVCADPGACTLPTCTEPPRDLRCVRCGSSGPGAWCSWCKAPVLLAEVRDV